MALRYYNLVPEHVAVVTDVTTGRPGKWKNEFGRFLYRHVHPCYFFGMERRLITEGELAEAEMREFELL